MGAVPGVAPIGCTPPASHVFFFMVSFSSGASSFQWPVVKLLYHAIPYEYFCLAKHLVRGLDGRGGGGGEARDQQLQKKVVAGIVSQLLCVCVFSV